MIETSHKPIHGLANKNPHIPGCWDKTSPSQSLCNVDRDHLQPTVKEEPHKPLEIKAAAASYKSNPQKSKTYTQPGKPSDTLIPSLHDVRHVE